jgi:hypothetical protein
MSGRSEPTYPPEEIPHDKLTLESVPSTTARWSPAIETFALTFNGYQNIGDEECGRLANKVKEELRKDDGALRALTLAELRGCLFFEQRRYRHFGTEPEAEERRYIDALLDAIRAAIEKRTNR